jgi:hypothetical protein
MEFTGQESLQETVILIMTLYRHVQIHILQFSYFVWPILDLTFTMFIN